MHKVWLYFYAYDVEEGFRRSFVDRHTGSATIGLFALLSVLFALYTISESYDSNDNDTGTLPWPFLLALSLVTACMSVILYLDKVYTCNCFPGFRRYPLRWQVSISRL